MVLLFLYTCNTIWVVWGHWCFCAPTIIKNSHTWWFLYPSHTSPNIEHCINGLFQQFGVLARIVRHMKQRHMEGEDHPLRFSPNSPFSSRIYFEQLSSHNHNSSSQLHYKNFQLGGDPGWDEPTGCKWKDQAVAAARGAQSQSKNWGEFSITIQKSR